MSTSTPMARHTTYTQTYEQRADVPNTSPHASYLYNLIATKKTNLCFSVDVTKSADLLRLAYITGDSVCVLKTHCDIIDDWSSRVWEELQRIAIRKKFIIFEDRKFGDIGTTVQHQYTSGPLQIAKWAEIVNANIFPGPGIVEALEQAAQQVVSAHHSGVETRISGGQEQGEDGEAEQEMMMGEDGRPMRIASRRDERKGSVVSVTTTLSQRNEPLSPPRRGSPARHPLRSGLDAISATEQTSSSTHTSEAPPADNDKSSSDLATLPPPPFARSLLLLAQMSSKNNHFTPQYTASCVDLARKHSTFVIGFIAQQSLNTESMDNFITMTPGVQLPPVGQENQSGTRDGALGQQYNTPRNVIVDKGCDVVIVGSGILKAEDPAKEAERYRKEAWKAYEERVGR